MSETSRRRRTAPAKAQTYILFSVAGTTYALPSPQVQHIEMVEHVTPVPNAPAFVEGVVFSRGPGRAGDQPAGAVRLRARRRSTCARAAGRSARRPPASACWPTRRGVHPIPTTVDSSAARRSAA